MPRKYDLAHFEIDHIRAQVHQGESVLENLAWACFQCNNRKGPNLAGVDPQTDAVATLFHPREHNWNEHFEWNGAHLVGKTPEARATIVLLAINTPTRVAVRTALMDNDLF